MKTVRKVEEKRRSSNAERKGDNVKQEDEEVKGEMVGGE